jgi:hypothetical protein
LLVFVVYENKNMSGCDMDAWPNLSPQVIELSPLSSFCCLLHRMLYKYQGILMLCMNLGAILFAPLKYMNMGVLWFIYTVECLNMGTILDMTNSYKCSNALCHPFQIISRSDFFLVYSFC